METFCYQKFVYNTQECFAFTPQANFPAHNLKVKVMGLNPSYLFKYISTLLVYKMVCLQQFVHISSLFLVILLASMALSAMSLKSAS